MAKQTIKQRKTLRKVKGSLRRGAPPPSPATTPSAALETMTMSERLRAACDGHPHAKIPWPHRVLHEAADYIERLEERCQAYKGQVWAGSAEIDRLRRLFVPAVEGQAEALPRSEAEPVPSSFHSFIAKWWKR